MFDLTKDEAVNIDKHLSKKVQWAEENSALAEQLAMDASRLLSCTDDRLQEYANKGFFKRCVASFSGKTSQMQRANQNDLIQLQKFGWRYLQVLNERDILTAHSLITIKNNLQTLAIEDNKTKEEVTRLAIKVKQRFDDLSHRVENLEVTVNLLHWLSTIEVHEYEDYPYYTRILSLVEDFQIRKKDSWNFKDIQCLQQAILKAKIDRKEKITIHEFIVNLIDEIEDHSFELFANIIKTFVDNKKVDLEWVDENISSALFNSLYLIASKYNDSSDVVESLEKDINISKKEAVTKGIVYIIKKAGVDTEKELQLQDIALEILSCSKLAQTLIEKSDEKFEEDDKRIADGETSQLSYSFDNGYKDDSIEDLQLSLMAKNFSVGDSFGVVIDNKGVVKTYGSNYWYGCLGIGSNENQECTKPVSVLDVPQDIKCISVDAGYKHSVAMFENGAIYAWGLSSSGQLGDNTEDDRLSAFKCIGLPKDLKPVKILASAESSLVLFENGDLYATGNIVDSLVFVKYPLNFKIKDFDVMYDSRDMGIVLLSNDNKLFIKRYSSSSELRWCEHEDNGFFKPQGLHEDAQIVKIVAGSCYLFALTQNNTLYAIGDNSSGQLGINEYSTHPIESFRKVYGIEGTIKDIATNHKYQSISDMNNFTIVLTDSNIYGWGGNSQSQLGKKENYKSEYWETGIIKKERHEKKYYFEKKPKIIEDFKQYIQNNTPTEIACGNEDSYMYNKDKQQIYTLGSHDIYNYEEPSVKTINIRESKS